MSACHAGSTAVDDFVETHQILTLNAASLLYPHAVFTIRQYTQVYCSLQCQYNTSHTSVLLVLYSSVIFSRLTASCTKLDDSLKELYKFRASQYGFLIASSNL